MTTIRQLVEDYGLEPVIGHNTLNEEDMNAHSFFEEVPEEVCWPMVQESCMLWWS